LIKSRKVGLITNQSGVDQHGRSLVGLCAQNKDIDLVAIYGPEHGVRGGAQAGEYVPFYIDDRYNIPVFSLYGQSLKPDPDMKSNLDERMRSFDTVKTGKLLEPDMIKGVDVLLYDIQDVGTRIYTYTATMALCMKTCAESGLELIVLDRPNPINGVDMEGPILEYPQFSTFVGLYPIPVRHGMTTGELARLFNAKYLEPKVNLTVIPMEGWERGIWFDDTPLPWIPPSPNMPSLDTATVYPGQVFLEGTNVSEGRGTDQPFQLCGAPWINAPKLVGLLNALNLSGVHFEEASFTPAFSKYRNECCAGVRIQVEDREAFKPFATTLFLLGTIITEYSEHFEFHEDYFDTIMGTSKVRRNIVRGMNIRAILGTYDSEIGQFAEMREPFLLY
jgi:uncharacterized protein YbbC (DUF1343 family)